jgi:hypothetical protein
MRALIDRFSEEQPWVRVPFPLISTRPIEEFVDMWHLSEAGSVVHSHRIGPALADLMGIPPFTAASE